MDVSITEDKQYLILRNMTKQELDQIRLYFTKEPPQNWIMKKKFPDGAFKVEFFNRFGLLPVGLWMELITACKNFSYNLNFDPSLNDILQDNSLTIETFKTYIDNLFANAETDSGDKAKPMGYQIDGVFNLVKFKKASVEVTTSGGKTLMAYILYKFLKDVKKIKKCLYIVPNVNLATQSLEKFDK